MPTGLPKVAGDRDRLHQVMLNLIDNAIKYTPRRPRKRIEAHEALSANGSTPTPGVALVVADTGEGNSRRRYPTPDRAILPSRSRALRELGGTGLGLAIVKHIVQLHHGALRIESKVREGTTVTCGSPPRSLSLSSK